MTNLSPPSRPNPKQLRFLLTVRAVLVKPLTCVNLSIILVLRDEHALFSQKRNRQRADDCRHA
jgi:hypothetical protein